MGTQQEVRLTMADGIDLAATLYLPDPSLGPQPCLLEALPYRKDDLTSSYTETYERFRDEFGFACCRVDVRGTGSSQGNPTDEYPVEEQSDLAEVIGGAVALHLLLGLPLLAGGVIIGAASMLLLAVQSARGQRRFEVIVMTLLVIIAAGFLAPLAVSPFDLHGALAGLVPRLHSADMVLLAASMLGATVMPHAIYLHSALARDRHGYHPAAAIRARLIRVTRWDVGLALLLAGAVNIGMLLVAASSLAGTAGTDTIAGTHAAITAALGPAIGVVFALGLLASGLASTSVGSYAGAAIMSGLLHKRVPLLLRRLVTLIPALAVLAVGVEPTSALVLSQVLLSFGIPFALIPLIRLTGNRELMGDNVDSPALRVASWTSAFLIVALNVVLLGLTLGVGR